MSAPVQAGHHSTWPPQIRARYGITGRPRWVVPLLLLLGVAAVLAAASMVAQLANPAVAGGISSYVTVSDDHMHVEFQLQRRDLSPAVCVLRARAEDGFDVAYAEVTIPPGQGRTSHSYELRTAYRGFVGELLGCGVDGAPDGVAGAQFRPGVVPPEQPWTGSGS